MRQLEHLLGDVGFHHCNLCVDAMRLTFEIERPASIASRILRRTPDGMLKPLQRIIPTLIYCFHVETCGQTSFVVEMYVTEVSYE